MAAPLIPVTLKGALLVALGGALGSVARYAVSALLTRPAFPWGTVAVNLVGSFVLGAVMFMGAGRDGIVSAEARLLVAVGVLGGFTTMSTFAFELAGMLDAGERTRAIAFFLLNPVACVVAAFAGRALALQGGA